VLHKAAIPNSTVILSVANGSLTLAVSKRGARPCDYNKRNAPAPESARANPKQSMIRLVVIDLENLDHGNTSRVIRTCDHRRVGTRL